VVLGVLFRLSIVAWWEELFFRGYILQNMMAGLGLAWTVILTSVLFGFAHAFNPDASLLNSLLIAVTTPHLIYAQPDCTDACRAGLAERRRLRG